MRRPDEWVRSTDGIRLAVYRDGDPTAPTVVAVHGYPDNATVWDGVSALLADRFQLVRYDVRGAGSSQAPTGRRGYRMQQLVADLEAVVTATSAGRPVHLLGHDWGSIQAWASVTDKQLSGRIASFTSISGPCLSHVRPWLASNVRRGQFGPVARQLAHSYYLLAFQLPVLPELLWRSGLLNQILDGRERSGSQAGAGYRHSLPDELHGLQLYRANLFGRVARSSSPTTAVPVQVLAPAADPFVTQELQLQAPVPFASTLYRRPVPGGHWLPVTDPDLVARACTELIELVEYGQPSVGLVGGPGADG